MTILQHNFSLYISRCKKTVRGHTALVTVLWFTENVPGASLQKDIDDMLTEVQMKMDFDMIENSTDIWESSGGINEDFLVPTLDMLVSFGCPTLLGYFLYYQCRLHVSLSSTTHAMLLFMGISNVSVRNEPRQLICVYVWENWWHAVYK